MDSNTNKTATRQYREDNIRTDTCECSKQVKNQESGIKNQESLLPSVSPSLRLSFAPSLNLNGL